MQGLLSQLACPARIVVVSSGTHDPAKRTGMPAPQYTSADALAQANPAADPREPIGTLGRRRYTTSKLCNVLFAYELDRRLRENGSDVTVNVFDPGLLPGSGLARDYTGPQRLAWRFVGPLLRVLPGVNSTRASGHEPRDARHRRAVRTHERAVLRRPQGDDLIDRLVRPRKGGRPLGDERTADRRRAD